MNMNELGRFCQLALTLACAAACGANDITELGPNVGASVPDGAETDDGIGSVRGSLSLDGDDLIVSLRNRSNFDAKVALDMGVDSPASHSSTELGELVIPAGEQVQHVIPSRQVAGLDLAGEWLRAELSYRYQFEDGSGARRATGLALREGAAVPAEEAIEHGLILPDRLLEGDEPLVIQKATTFRVCFTNAFTFKASGTSGSLAGVDTSISPNLAPDTVSLPMPRQTYYAYYPSTASSSSFVANLDANGCTQPIERQTASGTSWKFRLLSYTGGGAGTVYALDSAGNTPSVDVVMTIPATTDPSPGNATTPKVVFVTDTTEHAQLHVATFLAANTARRVATIGVNIPAVSLLRVSPSVDGNTKYCFGVNTGQGCPTEKTLRVETNLANDRGVISHEAGHWLTTWCWVATLTLRIRTPTAKRTRRMGDSQQMERPAPRAGPPRGTIFRASNGSPLPIQKVLPTSSRPSPTTIPPNRTARSTRSPLDESCDSIARPLAPRSGRAQSGRAHSCTLRVWATSSTGRRSTGTS